MRHSLYIIIGSLMLGLGSCSRIDMDERLEEVSFLPEEMIERNVLIEDFTGQNCPNCPEAASLIEYLEEGYEGHVIGVSLHAGNLAMGQPLYSDEAQYHFSLLGNLDLPQPSLRVNRAGQTLTGLTEITPNLHNAVRTQLLKTTPVSLSDLQFTAEGAEVSVKSTQAMQAHVQMWVVEDGIVSRQKLIDGSTDKQYVHHSVYRTSLTPLDGEAVSLSATPVSVKAAFTPAEKWKLENLSLVVIVTAASGEVLQVEKTNFAQ